MRVAVFGSNGMAGHIVVRYLRECGHDVITVAKNDSDLLCNVEDFQQVTSTLSKLYNCDFIINCVGLLVKNSIDRPDRAAVINSWFPHYLEYWYKNTQTRIVHLSTDCVFDGSQGNYRENDVHTEMNAYGSSKSLGELNNKKDVTFRMSILGPEIKPDGTSLLHWITTTKETKLNGFVDAMWNGITTLQLAKCIEKYIKNPTITGVHHVVNNDYSINKFDLLCLINDVYGLGKTIVKSTGPKIANKVLIDTKGEIDWEIPNYRTQLIQLRNYTVK